LQEQNVTLGLTNRICSLFAKVVLLSFEASFKYFRSKKARVVGNPVRKNILTVDRDAALASLGLAKNKVKILVLGGSQGARALNEVVCDLVKKGIPAGFEIIHVIGKRDLSSVIAKLAPEVDPSLFYNLECLSRFPGGANYYFVDYLTDISLVLAAADLVVSRAGATVLSEIMARGLPSILVPFPYAAENHQAINAAVLQDMGIAVVLKQDQLNSTNLLNLIFEITGGTKLGQMASAAPKLKPKDAAARIVDIMCQVAKK
jgi:UDP-N-acetylglucosamine--N-acetylmuramyl-(pentapeptide) pyrophosphoryl-undecaprenol N-acetylglucosamine transferase